MEPITLEAPYLLFLGDAEDALSAKTARGILDWRPELCVGQLRLTPATHDLGLPDMTPEAAAAAGARTLVVGVANAGGRIPETWLPALAGGLEAGLDLAAGMHRRLGSLPSLREIATRTGRKLVDVREPPPELPTGTGARRPGRRLLTVGTDCSCGKMYTTLALERAMREAGMKATLRATGQTGILIAGSGIPVDAVVADFISGAVEVLTPPNDPDHWDLIEGQGSLFHPAFAGVSLGLLHGAQADALVLCHEPTRTHLRGLPEAPVPDPAACLAFNLEAARLTNPKVRAVGVSVNTAAIADPAEARDRVAALGADLGLPSTDPYRFGVEPILEKLGEIGS